MTEPSSPLIYAGWRAERWETPVSDAGSLRLVSLLDDGALHLVLEDAHHEARLRWRFTFRNVPAYLNLLEEYRLELWAHEARQGKRLGWTVQVPDSPWLARLYQSESLLELHHPGLVHYQVGTEDDVIDILAPTPPLIEELGPAPADSPPAGRSTTLFWSRDRAQIEQSVEAIASRARDEGDSQQG